MKNAPLVSVIIPAYNRVDYIDQAVMSVLNQSYLPIELIVVDDGSTDGTYELLKNYGSQIQLLTHPGRINKGQSTAINLGLSQARGKYIAILDSDDYWLLNKLEMQVGFLEEHPEIGLVYGNGHYVDAEGEILFPFHDEWHVENNDPGRVLLDCYMLLPQNALVRRVVYDKVGFFEESLRAAQDHDMLIRIAEQTKFAYIPDYLFYYRRHSASISAHGQEKRWISGFEILERARQRYPYRPDILRRRKAVLNFRLGQVYWREKRYIKASLYIIRSGFLDPVRAFKVIVGYEKING